MTRHPSKEKENREEEGEMNEDRLFDVKHRCPIMDLVSIHHSDQRTSCAPLGEETGRTQKYEKGLYKSLTASVTRMGEKQRCP